MWDPDLVRDEVWIKRETVPAHLRGTVSRNC
ncbi:hypothetical protein SCFA_40023 [anaerobic digester metagenome]|uniref:Uncharacterized protein n=1 Tax=anaerobic digester metagenome TaxID=1263854 RepID=A0A485M2X9_9ZZZZ